MYVSEALTEGHNRQSFDCGNPILNDWLARSSLSAENQRTTRTFVVRDDANLVLGYYSLTAHVIEAQALPKKYAGNTRGQIPAVLLAKLAVDKTCQGTGLGAALLADALGRALDAARQVGARFVVVDAIDKPAHSFYRKHGFAPIPDTDRLLMKMSSIEASL
ncbi:GNAT family N-acetyltransferase [Kitasatospora sp. NPDC059571]|uniref:GNAT family N-acetyltransferase n=1 Tax=Kitasatospora sp. NPDC059571 TaxID=3346871 RepID=UPI0036A119E5